MVHSISGHRYGRERYYVDKKHNVGRLLDVYGQDRLIRWLDGE